MPIQIQNQINFGTAGIRILTINATSEPLDDRIRLFDALKLELIEMQINAFAMVGNRKLEVYDVPEAHELHLRHIVCQFESRDKRSAHIQTAELPTAAWWHRLLAWALPQHDVKTGAYVSTLRKQGRKWVFSINLACATSDYAFLRGLKEVAACPSCRPSSVKVRNGEVLISSKSKDAITMLLRCAHKLNNKDEKAAAVCPALLRLKWLLLS